MTCLRCQGLMLEDQFLDLQGGFGEMWTTCLRCLNCGHVHDAVIEQHRSAQPAQVFTFPSSEPDYQDDEVYLGSEAFIRRAA